jgi:uncharacterized protein (TIGR02599 family)
MMRDSAIVLRSRRSGMTLLEVLASTVILSIVLLSILAAIQTMQSSWVRVRAKADPFRGGRLVVDTMARRIAEATLQQRWVMEDKGDATAGYMPYSDLHFISGPIDQILSGGGRRLGHGVFFQSTRGWEGSSLRASNGSAPANQYQEDSINAWGYYVEYGGDDSGGIPDFIRSPGDEAVTASIEVPIRDRFRLYEWRQASADVDLFRPRGEVTGPTFLSETQDTISSRSWYQSNLNTPGSRKQISLIAENVIAFALVPVVMDENGNEDPRNFPGGIYDTRDSRSLASFHRLPKAFRLTALLVSPEAWSKQPEGQRYNFANQLMTMTSGKFNDLSNVDRDFRAITDKLDAQRPPLPYQLVSSIIPMAEGSVRQVAPPN